MGFGEAKTAVSIPDPTRDPLPAVHRRFTRPSTATPQTIPEEAINVTANGHE